MKFIISLQYEFGKYIVLTKDVDTEIAQELCLHTSLAMAKMLYINAVKRIVNTTQYKTLHETQFTNGTASTLFERKDLYVWTSL